MSEEVALADANLREIARLRQALHTAQDLADYYRAQIEAEHAAQLALERLAQALRRAVRGLLAEPHGCPMCDAGVLRNAAQGHANECPYALARAVLEINDRPRPEVDTGEK